MSDTLLVGHAPAKTQPQPLPGCCPSHPDWATLAQHLVVEFAALGARTVVDIVRHARDAVELAALTGGEALVIAEKIARYQLLLLCGAADDVARLDPEQHDHRSRTTTQRVIGRR